ncbi:NAD(P)H-dependent flavin oxidoreductase [Aminobacter sp. BE322]|uniref:NAD(P)H-dependent flavin oxidoreductase n=1 Tax=unclassified Aminobacter TaxID=2644704 RepID=UPI003D1912B3
MWPDRRILDLLGLDLPILQAPMAGPVDSEMVVAVSEAGGLGGLPCALMTLEKARAELGIVRQRTSQPINVNFFCHRPPHEDAAREAAWKKRLEPFYLELGLDPAAPAPRTGRAPFDDDFCAMVEEFRPEVVSFHFGLPEGRLLDRVKATGAKVLSSATTAGEAVWLEQRGCDVIVAQGAEAGGHRGIFLTDDVANQAGTFALVPQVVDAVKVPVIAAGGIGDARGIVAAFALGASAVQIGTAYLFCPEAKVPAPHKAALSSAKDDSTALTNIFTGRPARGIVNRVMREVGPLSGMAPDFPLAGGALAPLRAASEPKGSGDFMSLWSGQAARLGREMPAGELTRTLAAEAQALFRKLAG